MTVLTNLQNLWSNHKQSNSYVFWVIIFSYEILQIDQDSGVVVPGEVGILFIWTPAF